MPGRLLAASCAALVLVTPAFADGGPSPGVSIGGNGVAGTAVRYVILPARKQNVLEAIQKRSGVVQRWVDVDGHFGIPQVAFDGSTGGLARNGSVLILSDQPYTCSATGCSLYKTRSRFQVVDPKTLTRRKAIVLKGDFAFDALSPNGRRMYLIEYVSKSNLEEYQVRAYDLRRDRLLPGVIADRTQRGWTMQGSPMTRVTSSNGRFVYTLYENPGGYPFVHALDAVRGTAHCIGIPWTQDQSLMGAMHMTLGDGGRTLSIGAVKGRPFFTVDTRTYRVSEPDLTAAAHHAFPWWVVGVAAAALGLAAGAVRATRVTRRLRRRAAPA